MPCFYCGKNVSVLRKLTDPDFCCDEHRERYHELAKLALNRLVEAAPAKKGRPESAPRSPAREPRPPEAEPVPLPPPAGLDRPTPARWIHAPARWSSPGYPAPAGTAKPPPGLAMGALLPWLPATVGSGPAGAQAGSTPLAESRALKLPSTPTPDGSAALRQAAPLLPQAGLAFSRIERRPVGPIVGRPTAMPPGPSARPLPAGGLSAAPSIPTPPPSPRQPPYAAPVVSTWTPGARPRLPVLGTREAARQLALEPAFPLPPVHPCPAVVAATAAGWALPQGRLPIPSLATVPAGAPALGVLPPAFEAPAPPASPILLPPPAPLERVVPQGVALPACPAPVLAVSVSGWPAAGRLAASEWVPLVQPPAIRGPALPAASGEQLLRVTPLGPQIAPLPLGSVRPAGWMALPQPSPAALPAGPASLGPAPPWTSPLRLPCLGTAPVANVPLVAPPAALPVPEAPGGAAPPLPSDWPEIGPATTLGDIATAGSGIAASLPLAPPIALPP